MSAWPDARVLELFNIEVPIVLRPMAGAAGMEPTIAMARGGGLDSLPCAIPNVEQIRQQAEQFRAAMYGPINLNFFCHTPPQPDPGRDTKWRAHLALYYAELGIDLNAQVPAVNRVPFDEATCALVEELRPEAVSSHFGLPSPELQARVKATGTKIISAAATMEEAHWLEVRGVDAIIAMGNEVGGHCDMFLVKTIESQVGTFALVPQMVDAVKVPVIAAGGIGDARDAVAASALGVSAVQIGTAYILLLEVKTSAIHRTALKQATDVDTALTNLFTGRPTCGIINRPMREIGPMSTLAPAFPTAGGTLAPLCTKTEPTGSDDFISLWFGQAGWLATEDSAETITRRIAVQALEQLTQVFLLHCFPRGYARRHARFVSHLKSACERWENFTQL